MHVRRRWLSLSLDVALISACAAGSLSFGGSVVSGGSMEPALKRGDVVVYRKGAGQRPDAGDLVVLGGVGHRYVHRVVTVSRGGMIVTRGDANPIPDLEPTATAAIQGRVVAVLPSGRICEGLATSARHARLWSQSHSEL